MQRVPASTPGPPTSCRDSYFLWAWGTTTVVVTCCTCPEVFVTSPVIVEVRTLAVCVRAEGPQGLGEYV